MKKFLLKSAVAAVALAQTLSVAEAKTLKAAGDVGFAPYSMMSASGEMEGYNIDILAGITKQLGYDGYTVGDVPFSSLFVALNSGQYDIGIAATQVNAERGQSILFAEPYIEASLGVLVRKADAGSATTIDALKGKSIAVNQGTLADRWFTEHAKEYGWTISRYGKNSDAVQAVLSGRDFAAASGDGAMAWISKQNPMLSFNITIPTGGSYAFVLPKDNIEMRNKVEMAIECMKASGEIAKIHEKWIGKPPKAGGLAYTPLPGYGVEGVRGYDPKPHELTCVK